MIEIFALLIESTSYYRKHLNDLILEKLIGNILLDAFQHSFKKDRNEI
jgi:hypothetical protein